MGECMEGSTKKTKQGGEKMEENGRSGKREAGLEELVREWARGRREGAEEWRKLLEWEMVERIEDLQQLRELEEESWRGLLRRLSDKPTGTMLAARMNEWRDNFIASHSPDLSQREFPFSFFLFLFFFRFFPL